MFSYRLFPLLSVLCLLAAVSRGSSLAAAPPVSVSPPAAGSLRFHRVPSNLVHNASFEQNWSNRAFAENRRFLLLQASDMGVGEADGHVDHWRFEGAATPEAWDTDVSRSGGRSIRLNVAGRAYQRVRFAGEQHWKAGGSQYAAYLPMEQNLAAQLAKRPIIIGAWCRADAVPANTPPQLVVRVDCMARQDYENSPPVQGTVTEASAVFSAGTHGWEYREVRIEPAKLLTTPHWVTVSLVSPANAGSVWFDDVSCVEEPSPDQPNRLANAGFEGLDAAGWATDWQPAAPWPWFRNNYYSFTGWSHGKSRQAEVRGAAVVDRLLAHSGAASLRLTVFPGDQLAVPSAPITLTQDRPRPIEVRAMVKADRLRTLEIMAKDEKGQWLPQGDFLGDDMEDNPALYNMGSTGSGTYDWQCVRKYFSPRKPVKTLRLFLCARGFDGVIVEKNQVGTVWFDDLQLFEHGAPNAAAPPAQPAPAPALYPFRVVDLDLGDRLWGRNTARVVLENTPAAASAALQLQVTDPAGAVKSFPGKTEVVSAGEGGASYVVASAPYTLDRLCKDWKEQYALALRLSPPGMEKPPSEFRFGTPSRLMTEGASAHYAYPDETVSVYANLNVARDSFADLDRCEVVLDPGGKERKLQELRDFAQLLRPQVAPKYIDTARLVQAKLGPQGLAVHPWSEPVRDNVVALRLFGRDGKLLAESPPVRFGFMQPVPKPDLPETIRKTAVDGRGYLTVNGQPYFPVYWTPHFGVLPEASYPPRLFGYKQADLTEIVLGKGSAPDAAVKAKLLAKVAELKADPKFFQYELGEGEMQLQGGDWEARAGWLKQAAQWIREADPDHLISGTENWLIGHPRHNEAMPAFIPHFDAIGVETSFEAVPKIAEVAKPLMKTRQTAVLVGLETYFYQPLETLRWRGYRSVLEGAAGVGLCPSGMLESRPDRVNYLRGLNGEFRGLGPVITAVEPPARITCAAPGVEMMERVHQGKRYLFALRSAAATGAAKARFTLPKGAAFTRVRVLFEGRSLTPAAGAFEDDFATPKTVHVYELSSE